MERNTMKGMVAVGSSEVLLKLLASYQGSNGRRPDPTRVWEQVAAYVRDGGAYQFYRPRDCQSPFPTGRYLEDIEALVEGGFVEPRQDGCLEVTSFGRSVAATLRVPSEVAGLQERLNAENH